jgi:soluble lytic murein transglycosylase-like protein
MNTKSRLITLLVASVIFTASNAYAMTVHRDRTIEKSESVSSEIEKPKPESKNDANKRPVANKKPKTDPTPVSTPKPAETVQKTRNSAHSNALNPRIPYMNLCPQYESIISQYNWDVRTAIAIMKAESGCNPVRDNAGLNSDGTNDVGLMQINSIHVSSGAIAESSRRDPADNIAFAYRLYSERGNFTAWTAYTSGAYTNHL